MTVFGEDIYSMLEPLEDRPPHAIRIARTVHRVRTALNSEFCKLEKATLSDRTIVGFALWQKPTRSFMPHVLIRNEANEDTQEDRDAWVGLNVEMWNMLHDHDEGALRESVMGAEPHWCAQVVSTQLLHTNIILLGSSRPSLYSLPTREKASARNLSSASAISPTPLRHQRHCIL